MPDTFERIAGKLIENETALGRLYELFGLTFAPDAELWASLAQDERQHAEWIRAACEAAPPGQRQQGLPAIRLAAIEHMTQYVESIAARCRRRELAPINALALARDLENSLIEGKLLGSLSTGAASLAGLEHALVKSTTDHRQRIVEALDRLRAAG